MSRAELMEAVGLSDRKHFARTCLQPGLGAGLVEMTLSDSPRSRTQRYRLTALGRQVRDSLLDTWRYDKENECRTPSTFANLTREIVESEQRASSNRVSVPTGNAVVLKRSIARNNESGDTNLKPPVRVILHLCCLSQPHLWHFPEQTQRYRVEAVVEAHARLAIVEYHSSNEPAACGVLEFPQSPEIR